jgi:hypothetical protein
MSGPVRSWPCGRTGGTTERGVGPSIGARRRLRTGGWLALAAAPTFAIMALISATREAGAAALLCASDASPLTGMAAMYLLMSVFHTAPWLTWIAHRRRGVEHRV